jgi:hypothetical protein
MTTRNPLPRISALAFLTAAGLLAACSPQVLPPSGPHPVLAANQVQIYQAQPKKYELLGTLLMPITPDMKWDERGDCSIGFEALKAKAAAQGANGVLLSSTPGSYDLSVGAGYQGKFYLVPMKNEPRTAVVQAIFVLEQ